MFEKILGSVKSKLEVGLGSLFPLFTVVSLVTPSILNTLLGGWTESDLQGSSGEDTTVQTHTRSLVTHRRMTRPGM